MKAWNDLTTEDQEKAIGRKKFNDIELADEKKLPNAHNVVSQDNDGGVEHKIVRMNVPFSNPAKNENGTYFIGYARHWMVTKRMLTTPIGCWTFPHQKPANCSSFRPNLCSVKSQTANFNERVCLGTQGKQLH